MTDEKRLDVPEGIERAWEQLPESGKKQFCLKLYELDNRFFDVWIKWAGLNKGGFRKDGIAKRKKSWEAQCLDKAFFICHEGRFAKSILRLLLPLLEPELHDYCEKIYEEGNGNAGKRLASALESLQDEFAESLFLNLYIETAKWHDLDWFEAPTVPIQEEEPEAPEDEQNYLKSKLNNIKTYVSTLREELDKVECARSIDKDFFLNSLTSALETGEELRKDVSELCREHNCSKSDWQSLSELESIIEFLSERINNNNSAKRHMLEELLSLLEARRIIHRSNSRRVKLDQLKNDACQELKVKIAEEIIPDNFNLQNKSPEEWLPWILTTSGSALDDIIKELSITFPALSIFLEEIEADNLEPIAISITAEPENPATTVVEPAADTDQEEIADIPVPEPSCIEDRGDDLHEDEKQITLSLSNHDKSQTTLVEDLSTQCPIELLEKDVEKFGSPDQITEDLLSELMSAGTVKGEHLSTVQSKWLSKGQNLRGFVVAKYYEEVLAKQNHFEDGIIPSWICWVAILLVDLSHKIIDENMAELMHYYNIVREQREESKLFLFYWLTAGLFGKRATTAMQIIQALPPQALDECLDRLGFNQFCNEKFLIPARRNILPHTKFKDDPEEIKKHITYELTQAKLVMDPAKNNFLNARIRNFWRDLVVQNGPVINLLNEASSGTIRSFFPAPEELAGEIRGWETIVSHYRHNILSRITKFLDHLRKVTAMQKELLSINNITQSNMLSKSEVKAAIVDGNLLLKDIESSSPFIYPFKIIVNELDKLAAEAR